MPARPGLPCSGIATRGRSPQDRSTPEAVVAFSSDWHNLVPGVDS